MRRPRSLSRPVRLRHPSPVFPGSFAMHSFIRALPKVELHVHLVGSAGVDTVLELARRHPEAEVTVTPHNHVTDGMSGDELLAGLESGRASAASAGVELAWCFDIPGEKGSRAARTPWAESDSAGGVPDVG